MSTKGVKTAISTFSANNLPLRLHNPDHPIILPFQPPPKEKKTSILPSQPPQKKRRNLRSSDLRIPDSARKGVQDWVNASGFLESTGQIHK